MESVRLIYIRADGNPEIASGHLTRCLTIARELIKAGNHVCFLVSDEESVSILTANEPNVVAVTSDFPCADNKIGYLQLKTANYRNLDLEINEISSLLQMHPGILLVDSYFVTKHYLNWLRTLTKVAYMDDIRAFDYPVDLLINYDCFTESMKAECSRDVYRNATDLLLGAEYAPLRPQFCNATITVREVVNNVLVTTGSSDPYHFSLQFCEKLLEENRKANATDTSITYHIVVGSLNSDYEELLSLSKQLPTVQLHKDLTDLMPLMLTCDLAITAGGTTLYELCALGIPSISFSMAENQISNPQILDELEIIPYAGDIRTQLEDVLPQCLRFVEEYSTDIVKRKAVHTKMNSLITGNGAYKIAQAIATLSTHSK